MRQAATILHADLDAFYASVEQRDNPRLKGKPVLVGGGVVLAASYEAKAFGVHGAMGLKEARRLCPHAIVVEPHFDAYVDASKAVFEIFDETAPFVEGISIDEAFLDVSGMEQIAGSPVDIATRLRAEVREKVGLPITVGIARTKHLAKVASGVAKPDGLLYVSPDAEIDFLHPLAVEHLWGVGAVTARKLHTHGIRTVGQIAAITEESLQEMIGKAAGRHVHALACNRDPRPLVVGRRRRSIGSQSAFGRSRRTREALDATLLAIADRVTRRMRTAKRVGRTVILRMRFDDFTRATRSHTLPWHTADTQPILKVMRELLAATQPLIEAQGGLTLLGLSVTNLANADAVQLPLPFERRSPSAVDAAVDAVRSKFGSKAITRAALLNRDTGFTVPLLPD